MINGKKVTVAKKLFGAVFIAAEIRLRIFFKLCHSESIGNMKLSGLAVLTETVIIKNSVCCVAAFLNLGKKNAFADSMECTGIDKEEIAGLNLYGINIIRKIAVLNGLFELLRCNLILKAEKPSLV